MYRKPVSRRSILNDLLVLVVVTVVALVVILKYHGTETENAPAAVEEIEENALPEDAE